YRLGTAGPLPQALHAVAYEFQLPRDLPAFVRDGVDVERGNVAAVEVGGIVFSVPAAHAAATPVVPRGGFAEVEQDGSGRIGRLDALVVSDNFFRRDGWAPALRPADGLRVVRL